MPPDAVVRYAPHDDGIVDVHLPTSGTSEPAPLVILLHGGFWKQAYDRRHTRPLAGAIAREGYVVATPEYRRVGGAGGWPATVDDVDTAVGAVPALLAGLGVDVTRTVVAGHSAGGHLALWIAGTHHRPYRVVGLAPVSDLRAAARERLGDGATQALLGGEPDEVPERYDAADPFVRLASPPQCPVVVVHGTDDDAVPVTHSRRLAQAHPHVELRELPSTGHFAVIDPTSHAWPTVLDAIGGTT